MRPPASRVGKSCLAAIVAVQLLLIFWSGRHELSPDESRYAWAVSQSWSGLFAWLGTDNHPPLYLIFLKAWAGIFGISETALRASNMIWAPLMTIALHRGCSAFLSPRSSLFIVSVFCFNPLYLFLCGIAKYYIAFMLLSFVASALFQKILARLEAGEALPVPQLARWGAVCALLLWTHYLGGILLFYFAGLLIVLSRRRRILPPMAALAAAGATFVPWVLVLLGQLGQQVAPPELTASQYVMKAVIRTVYTAYAFLFGTTLELGRFVVVAIGVLSVLAAIVTFSISARRHGVDKSELLPVTIYASGGFFALCGALIVMMVMLPGHPDLSMPERVSFVLPHFVLPAAWLVHQIRNRGKTLALVLYGIACAVSLWHLIRWDENNAWDYIVPWREMAADAASATAPRAVLFDSDSFGAEGWYYFSRESDQFISIRDERESQSLGEINERTAAMRSIILVRSVRDGTPMESLNMVESNLRKAHGPPDRELYYVTDSRNLMRLKDFARRGTPRKTLEHKIKLLIIRGSEP
ncbi:hypothetical protein IT570_11595 [Candidatus Sumerlaeota bacterium]|nr:hypothetical protein [Candidatus Sumerlaeota bacterium]